MKVNELVEHVNRLTDEDFDADMIVGFLNDAMAKINSECDANFPYLDITQNDAEPVFPEKWQRLLLCTFAAGRVKENDSSQFEYQDFYAQYDSALLDFKGKYIIPEEYKDTSVKSRFEDVLNKSPWGW
jgi:hypothetical protein